ncbi:XRE family transcriptional regulator [Pseudorhizobium endolithicum]|uniref:XRE family transcriptional regulator n=1 Tax=Pseudorhizobium endolithicum TaxID=1191678 RepID=A0ABN7JPA3_9HYPH|nr:helix-turn-helix domain-containing protein [Pseudorhizobium endolithicum]CAD6418699.1 XRE family transcriptional regulator [Rhizobium sp. Q54]CAD7033109.1 XRE family transcriptional regulator [Pseudorhizobium endolithicum]
MLTGIQLRAGRAIAGLSIEELAAATGLSAAAITEAETAAAVDPAAAERLRLSLEAKGVVFLAAGEDNPGAGPGVRLRQRNPDEGIRPQNLSSANDG